MRTVIYDAADMEPITVIDVPLSFLREIEAGERGPILNFAVMPLMRAPGYLAPSATDIQDIKAHSVSIRFEPIYHGTRRLMWLATTMDGDTALLLKSVFLPGQQRAVNEGRDRAFMRGMLAAMGMA